MASQCEVHPDHHSDIQKLKEQAIPTWLRALLITGLIAIAGYGAQTYATKTELREVKQDLKGSIQEVKSDVKQVLNILSKGK